MHFAHSSDLRSGRRDTHDHQLTLLQCGEALFCYLDTQHGMLKANWFKGALFFGFD